MDPFNEELHGLRLYGWVQDYLIKRGWVRAEESRWFSNADFDEYGRVTIGHAFEIQLREDGIDLEVGAGPWQ